MGKVIENAEVPSDLLMELGGPVIFHNAKFDIHVLKRAGVKIPEAFKFYDTMLMAHLVDENEFSYDLNAMVKKYCGIDNQQKEKEIAKLIKDIGWTSIPPQYMAKYAEADAKVTLDLYKALKSPFSIYEDYWETESRFLLLLQEMEYRGIAIDLEKVKAYQLLCIDRLKAIEGELGIDPAKPSQLHKKLFSQPPIGYGLKVIETTPTGKPKVGDKFLRDTQHPVIGVLKEWRVLSKQLSSYYNSYEKLCSGYGRLHPSFKQHGTVTGRLSCANPNMQQIPRDSPIKGLFKSEPGKQLWEIDYKNIEMRLAAVYSKELSLLETFAAEGDVHQLTADLLGITRQHAKIVNFLIIYGGGANALSVQLGKPASECKKILDRFHDAYPRLFATMQAANGAAMSNGGYVKLWSGRRRHFRFSSEYHKAFNSIIQGGSFEIVKRSMLDLQVVGFDMRNQVHDSVWILVDDKSQVEKAERIMADWTEDAFGLKFSVESKRLA